jgi:hypothetical protein
LGSVDHWLVDFLIAPLPAMESPLAVGTPRPSAGFPLRTALSSDNTDEAQLTLSSVFIET